MLKNFYKKYGKAKTAVKEKQVQLEEVSRQIAYLESVASYAERAETVEEDRAAQTGAYRIRLHPLSKKTERDRSEKTDPDLYLISCPPVKQCW